MVRLILHGVGRRDRELSRRGRACWSVDGEYILMSANYRQAASVALFACLLVSPAWAATERAYVGTYTADPAQKEPRNHGEGIYLVDVDTTTGMLSNVRLMAKTPSPGWIALSPDGKFLYAGNEIANFNGTKSGSVSAFAVDNASGKLTFLNAMSSEGAGPAYVAVHPSGRYVLSANYAGGSLTVLPVKADGSLGAATDVIHPTGPLNPPRASDNPPGNFDPSDHSASHVHMVGFDPKGDYVIADEAGTRSEFWCSSSIWRRASSRRYPKPRRCRVQLRDISCSIQQESCFISSKNRTRC